ncbi:RNase P and RNase MRP subunit [Pichia californica]|uniref:RNase P and RNase MRP subunit n=1 Tax=Pichia californica TaxID=460514 RepID=A0A9P6WRE0_9ASCO|nr:RNase P and RNase MRP subunit [[Candida] californica]KAG0691312.1 RNase P and RNase MRP subunit [[Candida] californica]
MSKSTDNSTGKLNKSLKGQEVQKKSIFKPLLTNPYTRKNIWPKISTDVQNDLLQVLETNVLNLVKQWNSYNNEEKKKFPDLGIDSSNTITGFNSIMKGLEDQIQINLKNNVKEQENEITMLFVCKNDISCSLLYMHLPTLCQLANVKLISLPKGSSKRLSSALGVNKKVEFLALRKQLSEKDKFLSLTVNSTVDDINVGFLDSIKRQSLNMNVKFILTEMPIKKKNKEK